METGTVDSIVNASKKTGTSERGGKAFTWNIMTVNVKTEDGKTEVADSFDTLKQGDKVTLTHDGQYTNAKLYKADYTQEMLRSIHNMVKDIHDIVTTMPDHKPIPDEPEPPMDGDGWNEHWTDETG